MPVDSGCHSQENAEDGDKNQSNQDSILTRKLKKILDSDIETDSEMTEALTELSSFFSDNTLRTRRFLRGDIERRSLDINNQFLTELTVVKDAVDDVHQYIVSISENAKCMQKQLDATKAKTRDLIQQTTALNAEASKLAIHETMINDYIEKFQLTEEEMSALRGGKSKRPGDQVCITPEFFLALDRVHKIHGDCKELLKSGQQPTIMEIMEEMSTLLEESLEFLYRWAQTHCSRSIESAQNTTTLAQAMNHLQLRPVYLKFVIDEYCSSRKALLVRAFLDALTVGGPHGTPRPIELHAHDSPRYVGDMLAWLHQAIPNENENVRTLLKSCDKIEVGPQCENAIGLITEDVCRPLKTRVEQILLLESEAGILYKLTNLLRFYMSTIKHVVPAGTLIQTLEDLDQLAHKQFMSVLQTTVQQQISHSAEPPRHDLAPTPNTMFLLNLLKEFLSGTSMIDEQKEKLQEIVDAIVDPLLGSLQNVASSFPSTDQDVFMLNSLYQVHLTLAMFQFNDTRLQSLKSDMQLHLDTLTSQQTSNLISNLDLQPICTMVAEQENKGEALAKIPGMEREALKQFFVKFDSFLVAPDVFLLPQARLLLSSSHRKNIQRRSLEVVAASYSQLYHAVVDPKNLYDNPTAMMPKTPEQVNLLLQI